MCLTRLGTSVLDAPTDGGARLRQRLRQIWAGTSWQIHVLVFVTVTRESELVRGASEVLYAYRTSLKLVPSTSNKLPTHFCRGAGGSGTPGEWVPAQLPEIVGPNVSELFKGKAPVTVRHGGSPAVKVPRTACLQNSWPLMPVSCQRLQDPFSDGPETKKVTLPVQDLNLFFMPG